MNRRICGSFLFEKKVWAVESPKTVILRKNSGSANSGVKDKEDSKKQTAYNRLLFARRTVLESPRAEWSILCKRVRKCFLMRHFGYCPNGISLMAYKQYTTNFSLCQVKNRNCRKEPFDTV